MDLITSWSGLGAPAPDPAPMTDDPMLVVGEPTLEAFMGVGGDGGKRVLTAIARIDRGPLRLVARGGRRIACDADAGVHVTRGRRESHACVLCVLVWGG